MEYAGIYILCRLIISEFYVGRLGCRGGYERPNLGLILLIRGVRLSDRLDGSAPFLPAKNYPDRSRISESV